MFSHAAPTLDTARKPSTRLGDLLLARRLLTSTQLEQALQLQKQRRQDQLNNKVNCLGDILIELGYIKPHHLKITLSWQERLRKTALAMALLPTLTGLLTGCGGSGGSESTDNSQNPPTAATASLDTPATLTPADAPTTPNTTSSPITNSTPINNTSIAINTSNTNTTAATNTLVTLNPLISTNTPAETSEVLHTPIETAVSDSIDTPPETEAFEPIETPPEHEVSDSIDTEKHNYGSIAVSWTKPVIREDGTPIIDSEIDYFLLEIRHESETEFQQEVISDVSIDSYSIIDLVPGNYEVRIATVDVNGLTSDYTTSEVEIL